MPFATLVTLVTVLATLPFAVVGDGYDYSSIPANCETITSTVDYYGAYKYCEVPACLGVVPVTQHCGCPSIYTTTVGQTACPAYCAATSYVTAIEECLPHSPPPYYTTTTTTPPPYYPPPTSAPYYPTMNTTTTRKHHHTTLTTCPAYTTCTGQTVTYTSTEVCPTTTCTCVLPSHPYTTTKVVYPTTTTTTTTTTTKGPVYTPPPYATVAPSPSYVQANVAGKDEAQVGRSVIGALVMAFFGLM